MITADEAAALAVVVRKLTGGMWSEALYDEMSAMLEAGWISAGELITASGTVQLGFENIVPQAALDALRTKVDKFSFMVNEREQTMLLATIKGALENGTSVGELAQQIEDLFAEGYHILNDDDKVVKRIPTADWSEMVARTELSRAQTLGQIALYQKAQIKKVVWMSNHGDTVCDLCDEADGTIQPLGDDFDGVDVDAPPAHPHCCCTLLPADEDVMYPGIHQLLRDPTDEEEEMDTAA